MGSLYGRTLMLSELALPRTTNHPVLGSWVSRVCKRYYGVRPTIDDAEFDELPTQRFTKDDPTRSLRTYMWGNAQTGAVGVAEYPRPKADSKKQPVLRKHHPIRLPFCELFGVRFKQISCGYGFTLFLTVQPSTQGHQVFATGINTDSQLGFHSTKRHTDKSMKVILAPIPIDLPLRNRKAKVLQVAAGRAHSVFLTEEGCFSTGNNAYGKIVPRSPP